VRTPSRIDQDVDHTVVDPGPAYVTLNGNPHFRAEVLLSSELGYRQLIAHNFYLAVASYYNQYRDLESYGTITPGIAQPPLPPIPEFNVGFVNGIEGHTLGVEILPDWQPTKWWDLKGSYSYIHLSLRDQPGITDMGTVLSDEGSTPNHGLEILSKINLPKRFQFDQVYRYASALSYRNVRGYRTMDARLAWQSTFHLEFSAVGQNLFQPQHVEFTGDPGPNVGVKRSVYGQITWKR